MSEQDGNNTELGGGGGDDMASAKSDFDSVMRYFLYIYLFPPSPVSFAPSGSQDSLCFEEEKREETSFLKFTKLKTSRQERRSLAERKKKKKSRTRETCHGK